MRKPDRGAGYLLAGLLGAVAGGAVVIIATRAIPRMMSQMMRAMMQDRMAQMEEMGCEPSEI
jgi:hypothetical protein